MSKYIQDSSIPSGIIPVPIKRCTWKFINSYSKVYSKKSSNFLRRSKKVTSRLLCINVCFTNRQFHQNIKVDYFFICIKHGVKVSGKLYFSSGSRAFGFLLTGVSCMFPRNSFRHRCTPFLFLTYIFRSA